MFTGYGRSHHWNEDHTTRELGKEEFSFALAAHNQSGSLYLFNAPLFQPLFFSFYKKLHVLGITMEWDILAKLIPQISTIICHQIWVTRPIPI